eukprot:scaffold22643_cov70-Skeletonema_dohrnii-CCMP3373.AAC.1
MKVETSSEKLGETRRNFGGFRKFFMQQVGERFNKECQPQVPMHTPIIYSVGGTSTSPQRHSKGRRAQPNESLHDARNQPYQ